MPCLMVASAFFYLLFFFLKKKREPCVSAFNQHTQSSLFVQRDKLLRRFRWSDAGLTFHSSDYFMKLKCFTV